MASRQALAIMQGSGHIFSEIYLHLNWHCHNDKPMIKPSIEPLLYEFLQGYCRKVKGIHFGKVGGTETHVHLVFQMEPFVHLSDFIGKIKGSSSHEMNEQFGAGTLQWQRGSGVVSFAKKNLPSMIRYVDNQKEHHKKGTIRDALEVFRTYFEKQRVA